MSRLPAGVEKRIGQQLSSIREQGLYKEEREMLGQQQVPIKVKQGTVLNFCANNYLGLANHPDIISAAKEGLDTYGYGMASVRFICGTQDIHHLLERRIAKFLGFDAAILHASCFDANGGLFEALLTEQDAVLSDSLNHASIIDGVRLCKARRLVYQHRDMADLELRLKEAASARNRLIATDGVLRPRRQGHASGMRGRGQGPHRDLYPGQGARRRLRRLRGLAQGRRGIAQAALAALSVLEQPRAPHRGCLAQGAGAHRARR